MRTDFERRLSDSLHELTPEPPGRYAAARRGAVAGGVEDSSDPDQPVALITDRRATQHRRRYLVPVAAGIALVAAAGVVVAVVASKSGSSDGYSAPAGSLGQTFDPPSGLSNKAIGPSQYSYRVLRQMQVDASGKPEVHDDSAMVDRSYVAPNGDILSFRTGSQHGCMQFPQSGSADFGMPSAAFFRGMPTDVGKLTTYLRNHVQGSSSRDEAVFVAVSDALRTSGGLASPRLRAAMVGALSRTPGVLVHLNQRDYLDRPAIRADFVDQRIRAGEIHSLYFDPTTFALLEERQGSNGQSTAEPTSSPGYNQPAPRRDLSTDVISGPAFVDVMVTDKVVGKLPTIPANCARS